MWVWPGLAINTRGRLIIKCSANMLFLVKTSSRFYQQQSRLNLVIHDLGMHNPPGYIIICSYILGCASQLVSQFLFVAPMQICWFPFVKGHSDIVVPMIPKPSKTNFHSFFFSPAMFGRVNWLFGKSYDVSHAMFTGRFGQVLDPDRKLFFGPNVAWNFLPGS